MDENKSLGNIKVEVTPDLIIHLVRAIKQYNRLWEMQKEFLDLSRWKDLSLDTRMKKEIDINHRLTEFANHLGTIDDGEVYNLLPNKDELRQAVELFDKYVSVKEVCECLAKTDPSHALAYVPSCGMSNISPESMAFWDNVFPHHANIKVFMLCAMKLSSVCKEIRSGNDSWNIKDRQQRMKELEMKCKQDVMSRVGMMADVYDQFLVCMTIYHRAYCEALSFNDETPENDIVELGFTLDVLIDILVFFTIETITSAKDKASLAMIGIHKRKYVKELGNTHNLPEALAIRLERCRQMISSTCTEIEQYCHEGTHIGERFITNETINLFGDTSSRRFRIMEIALEDAESGLVTWNYDTNRYEWNGSNQQLAFLMGVLFLGDSVKDGKFVFGKDMKNSNLNAAISGYWSTFSKTDFAQTRSMMKNGKAYPKGKNYKIMDDWLKSYNKKRIVEKL